MQGTNADITDYDWESEDSLYSLRLFVTGTSPVSVRAISNIKSICERYLKNRYDLEIIDIYQQPLLVNEENITAVPMLIKKFPLPRKRLVGDMSDTGKVLKGLGLSN